MPTSARISSRPAIATSAVGSELRRLRLDRGLTVAEAARRAGTSRAALGHWESGRHSAPGPALDKLLGVLAAPRRLRAQILAMAASNYAQLALASSPLGSPVDVGQVLRAMRLRRAMSQAQLAAEVSVAQSNIAKWENGDLIPDVGTIHTLCFALGATEAELTALSCARPVEREPGPQRRTLFRSGQPPPELREVILLGLEADCWWAATGDAAAEMFLCDARSERAKWYLQNGRLSEVEAPARAALRLARTSDCKLSSTVAVWTLFELSRVRSGAEPPTELLRGWMETVKNPSHVAWVLGMMGLARAAEGSQTDALEFAHRAIELASSCGADEVRNRIIDLAEVHLLLGNPDEAFATIESEDRRQAAATQAHTGDFEGLRTRARAILACGELPGDDVMQSLRSAVERLPTWECRQTLAKIERSYNRVASRKRPELPSLRPYLGPS